MAQVAAGVSFIAVLLITGSSKSERAPGTAGTVARKGFAIQPYVGLTGDRTRATEMRRELERMWRQSHPQEWPEEATSSERGHSTSS